MESYTKVIDERHHATKVSTSPKLICIFKAIPVKIMKDSSWKWTTFPINMHDDSLRVAKIIFKKKKAERGILVDVTIL